MIYEETKYYLKTKRKIGTLLIEVTSKCNFRCKHCYNKSSDVKNQLDLSVLRQIKEDLDKFSDVELIELSGGEFFLHNSWREIIELFKEYTIQITTNGTLLSKEILYFLRDYKVRLAISLDGLCSEDNYLRDPEMYTKIIQGIENVEKYYYSELVALHCTIHSRNIDNLIKIAKYCQKHNLQLNFGCLCKLGFGRSLTQEHIPSGEAIAASYERISEINSNLNANFSFPPLGVATTCTLLTYSKISPRITAEGVVYPCSSLMDDALSIGNIYEQMLSEMLLSNNKKLSNVIEMLIARSEYMKATLCAECYFVDDCGGGCAAYALAENDNDFLSAPKRFCRAARILKMRELACFYPKEK